MNAREVTVICRKEGLSPGLTKILVALADRQSTQQHQLMECAEAMAKIADNLTNLLAVMGVMTTDMDNIKQRIMDKGDKPDGFDPTDLN